MSTTPTVAIDRNPIDELVLTYAAERRCPTISWGVVYDGGLALAGTMGDAGPHTVYRIASMTKSFSAAATLLLRDEGALRLDEPVERYVPELAAVRGPTSDAAAITVRDLLSMTSGLVIDDAWADRHLDLTPDDFAQIVARGVMFAEPTGTNYEYSNLGFAILGRVVQRVTGQTIQQIVSERLLAPLGMDASTWQEPDHDDWARPMRWLDDRFVDELPPLGDGLIAPMGGIWSTVSDLVRWVMWMDDAFPARYDADGGGPLARASRREMQKAGQYVGTRTLRGKRAPISYGFGLQVLDEPDLGSVVSHSGGFPGYGSNMRWLRGRRLGVITLANSTYAPMTELGALIMDDVARQTDTSSTARPHSGLLVGFAGRLVDLLNEWDDAVADDLFADNVASDDSYERRAAAARAAGPLRITAVEPINDARATVRCIDAAAHDVTVTFALAPTLPHQIQIYEATGH